MKRKIAPKYPTVYPPLDFTILMFLSEDKYPKVQSCTLYLTPSTKIEMSKAPLPLLHILSYKP